MKWLAMALCLVATPVLAVCRQALVLALDISGSVDATEYRLQMDGLADALNRPNVREALFAMPGTWVDLTIFEWAGPENLHLTQPFVSLQSNVALNGVIRRLRQAERPRANPSTALGSAMSQGARMLESRSCWRRVLDLSGDGMSNTGPRPRDVRDSLGDLTVNALVIGADGAPDQDRRSGRIGELSAYFRAEVIHGPSAFVETAIGFEDYADAMERKLLQELLVVAIGSSQ